MDGKIRRRRTPILDRGVGLVLTAIMVAGLSVGCSAEQGPPETEMPVNIELPPPRHDSSVSLEQTLLGRRSVRQYENAPLSLEQVSQLLWAAQGVSEPRRGLRTAPSAGATYPLETYLLVGQVNGLEAGVYRYQPDQHSLTLVVAGDLRPQLADAALGQSSVREGSINIIFTAIYERTARRYGDRARRYVHMEAGHASQNVYLQATALDLGTVVIGAFDDNRVASILNLPQQEHPLYIMPVGP